MEKFPPFEFIKEEMEARNWDAMRLSQESGLPLERVQRVLSGEQVVIPSISSGLAKAFGTTEDFWTNLRIQYETQSSLRGEWGK